MKLVASDLTVVVLKGTGHWVLEERPKERGGEPGISHCSAGLCPGCRDSPRLLRGEPGIPQRVKA